nr:VPS35 endosomal protein sorting factor-like isoform X2 [Nicotiana tomentosiformis]
MELKFRHRDYRAEVEIHSFRRMPAQTHPLSLQSPSCDQVDVTDYGRDEFSDPLRGNNRKPEDSAKDLGSTAAEITAEPYRHITIKYPGKEWTSYKKVLMQKFPVSKMISVSSLSSSIMKTGKGTEKPSANAHLEELDDPQRFAEEGIKYITLQEYVSRLTELKDEISRAWHANDRITSFNFSIKVAKLLSDTSILQFYPTLFVLATEILDMLGDMVWERIRQKAEYTEDGTLVHLPDNFRATEICAEAKETCYNWFFKVGSIRELLPRIYLELAIFHCWRFLLQKPADNLPRLVMMARGIADPLVSFYCRLYLAHCAQKLPQRDIGHLIISMNDMNTLLMNGAHIASVEKTSGVLSGNRSSKLGLMEPAIEYVMKCLFRESCELQVGEILMGLGLGRNQSELFGNASCISLVLHHLLKELPIEIIFSNALDILHLIECSYDYSFDQCLNFKLLGLRLCENISQVNEVNLVMKKVIQVVSRFNSLDEYLNVVDAHIDIALQKHMIFYSSAAMVQSMMSSAIDRATCCLDLFIEHMLVQNEHMMGVGNSKKHIRQ